MPDPTPPPALRQLAIDVIALGERASARPWTDYGWDVLHTGDEYVRGIETPHQVIAHLPSGEYVTPPEDHQAAHDAAYIVSAANAAVPLAAAVLAGSDLLTALQSATTWDWIHALGAWRAGMAKDGEGSTIVSGGPAERLYDALVQCSEALGMEAETDG
jgi:hypothetical protein